MSNKNLKIYQAQRILEDLEVVVLQKGEGWYEKVVKVLNEKFKFTRAKANSFITSTVLKNTYFGFEDGLFNHSESNTGVSFSSMIINSNVELKFELKGRPSFKWFGKEFKIVMNKLDGVDFKRDLLTEAPLLDQLYEERLHSLILEGEFKVADLETGQKKDGIKGVLVMEFRANKEMFPQMNHSIWGDWGFNFLNASKSLLLIFGRKIDSNFEVKKIRKRKIRKPRRR